MVGQESMQFAAWLEADGLIGKLDSSSHAFSALPTEQRMVEELNSSVRGFETHWYDNLEEWPADHWIIGEAGNGDYYFVSRSGSFTGVWVYLHELREKELEASSLREFYNQCIQLERDAGNIVA